MYTIRQNILVLLHWENLIFCNEDARRKPHCGLKPKTFSRKDTKYLLFYHRSSKLHCQLFNTERRSGCISDIYAHSVFGRRADKVVFAFFTKLAALFPQRIFPKRERLPPSIRRRQALIFIRQELKWLILAYNIQTSNTNNYEDI